MRRLILLSFCSVAVGASWPASADVIEIKLQNRSSDTAYVVTAFASDLVPNLRNLTSIPLVPGASRFVTVSDTYRKCVFTFTADFNAPSTPGLRFKPRLKPFRVFTDINICQRRSVDLK